MSEPYSYHTFLFPFIWNVEGHTSIEAFTRLLSVGKRWFKTQWVDGKIPTNGSAEKWLQNYAAYQYFTAPANAAIFNTRSNNNHNHNNNYYNDDDNDNIVHCFEYRHKGQSINGSGKYTIIKNSGDINNQINIALNIINIRLHVYNTGVAILVLELENTTHKSIDDVNKINEFGRRINMPFFTPPHEHPVCADTITISFDEETSVSENFNDTLIMLANEFTLKRDNISTAYIMKPLLMLIYGNETDNVRCEGTTKTTNVKNEPNNVRIIPCIDDRMFVCCAVVDSQLCDELKGFDRTEEYAFLDGWDRRLLNINADNKVVDACGGIHDEYMRGFADETYLSNRLYKLLFIENSLTCQNIHMKRELLCGSIYRRWLDAGTLHGVTHHSLICVVSPSCPAPQVLNPFLTQYVQLAILVLAQRATILALSGEIAQVAESIKKANELKDALSSKKCKIKGMEQFLRDQLEIIEKVQAKYVAAQSQLFLSEATVQEQGVEIYQMLQEQLYIPENKSELDVQMGNLRDVSEICNDRFERLADEALNKRMFDLSLITLAIAILQAVPIIFATDATSLVKCLSGAIAAIALIAGIILLRKTLFDRKSKRQKKKK